LIAVINAVYDRRSLELINYEVIEKYENNHHDFYEKIAEAFFYIIESDKSNLSRE
jgi:hypothetical protein